MSLKIRNLFGVLIILSMVLSACATAQETVVAQPTVVAVEPTQAPAPTAVPPTEVPPTPEPAPDFGAVFTEVIASVPAEKGYAAVSPAKLNEELADKAPFLVDVRETAEVEAAGHIAGSVLIPVRTLLKNLDKLPGLDEPIVIVCASGQRGGIALTVLKAIGYTNVRSLGGGLNNWVKAGLPVEKGLPVEAKSISTPIIENQALFTAFDGYISNLPDGFLAVKPDKLSEELADKAPVLIDVRTQAEWDSQGYLEGAILIPFAEFMSHLDKLPAKDQNIVVYCGSGHRGAILLPVFNMLGYENVRNLGGGLGAWKTAKLPVAGWIDWSATWTDFISNLPDGYYTVSAANLNTELVEKAPFLLDVREASEVEAKGYIAGTVHIPVREVLKNLDKLPAKDQKIVIYCASGHRGAFILAALRMLGWTDVRNLGGGLGSWLKAELPVESGLPAAPAAGAAPEVDPVMLRDLDKWLSNLPDGFMSVSPANLNTELAGSPVPTMIDVRPEADFANGHIEGSQNIVIQSLLSDLTALPAKDAPVVLICSSGHRGALGLMAMSMMGWSNVRNLGGGTGAWTAAELPLVK